jgi:hypothetical protein
MAVSGRLRLLLYRAGKKLNLLSLLTSVIATCLQAGVNALDYLVAVQAHRQAVFTNPGAWLPWNYPAALVPT